MTTRRTLFAAASALVASLASAKSTLAQAAQELAKQADFLFVQTAKGMTFDKSTSKLTLNGVSPVTVMFSDRPERIAANMRTAAFVPFWSKGKDSFLSDPPNADISILEGDRLRQIVAVLQDPALQGDDLTYTVKVVQGDMPATGSDVSVFIDIIRHAYDADVVRRGCTAPLPAGVLPVTFRRSSGMRRRLTHNALNHGGRS